ncbi:conserved hypothetical protein [Lodderomyces elongisporus NRRL YB-4239]|uniref:Core domain-containing protein n=1 Tax=Lodderomyces elongisporus (strain ATCC 11503 / CBS 2605 / JCM 1781 / NBRC 1676 / NRRL YB-4239) TaxID=379508 RepID=A5E077_LODEL|nr:conserved hypothetical protein [Lodderomyces elongisporus NRRL YB-4239]
MIIARQLLTKSSTSQQRVVSAIRSYKCSQSAVLLHKRFNATATTNNNTIKSQPKTLKPSAFAFPSEPKVANSNSNASANTSANTSTIAPKTTESQARPNQNEETIREDIDDFRATKLVHGETNKVIAITERALLKLNDIRTSNPKDSALQIQVESGGCHGFQYNLHLIDLEQFLKETEDPEDVFVFAREEGNLKGRLVLDDSSLTILQDSKVDYTKELIGSQFKVVDSPYTSTSCGCGASFDFDFEKLEKKQSEEGK